MYTMLYLNKLFGGLWMSENRNQVKKVIESIKSYKYTRYT